jgi:hypothetical protein
MRARFFGPEASTKKTRNDLIAKLAAMSIMISIFGTFPQSQNYSNSITRRSMRFCIPLRNHRMIGRLATRRPILLSMQMALNLLEAARAFSPGARFILHRQTKFTATRRIGCRCANCRSGGKSSRFKDKIDKLIYGL